MILNLDTSIQQDSKKSSNVSIESVKGSWKKRHVIKKIKSAAKPKETVKETEPNKSTSKESSIPIKDKKGGMPMDKNFSSSLFTNSARLDHFADNVVSLPQNVADNPFSSSSFESLGLHPTLRHHLINKLSLESPTRIQSLAIPAFLNSSQDLILKAQTGSGKSLAFVLPMIHLLLQQKNMSRELGTLAVALVPTRELAMQLESVLKSILSFKSTEKGLHWIVQGLVIGGEKRKSEKARLRKGITILVSTPGRLLDHLGSTSCFDVSQLQWLVLDEADKMLELGMQEKILQIIDLLKQKHCGDFTKRTILCSATIEQQVEKLVKLTMNNDPLFITCEENQETISVPSQLVQSYLIVPAKLRLVSLIGLLKFILKKSKSQIIVFVSCCDAVDFYHDLFQVSHAKQHLLQSMVYKLHGNMTQQERVKSFYAYKESVESSILICTDVAARGLDLPFVTDIIQYDPPADVKDYIHRIGRTSRMGKEGNSFLFLLPSETEYKDVLSKQSLNIYEHKLVPFLKTLVDTESADRKDYESAATSLHLSFEHFLLNNEQVMEKAKKGYISHVRAYSTHLSSEKHIFHVKKLHLGHLAKSFALREAPTTAVTKQIQLNQKKSEVEMMKQKESQIKRKAFSHVKTNAFSEFADGNVIQMSKKSKLK